MRVLYKEYMPKRPAPKRYYNIRIDEETYKAIKKRKGKQAVIDFVRECVSYSFNMGLK